MGIYCNTLFTDIKGLLIIAGFVSYGNRIVNDSLCYFYEDLYPLSIES